MSFILHPWHLLVFALSAWINREQEEVIQYLQAENQILREKLGPGRILLNDDQRRRLAVNAKVLVTTNPDLKPFFVSHTKISTAKT
jgi:hypothetical protein